MRLGRAGQKSPEGVLPAKDGEIALRNRLPQFSPFSFSANQISFKFPTTTHRAKRLMRAPSPPQANRERWVVRGSVPVGKRATAALKTEEMKEGPGIPRTVRPRRLPHSTLTRVRRRREGSLHLGPGLRVGAGVASWRRGRGGQVAVSLPLT